MGVEAISRAGTAYQASPVVESNAGPRMETEAAQAATVQNTQVVQSGETGSKQNRNEEEQSVSSAQIKKAIDDINKKAYNSEAIFGIHEETNRVTIKIVDRSTKEVIKEFPPEKTLNMIAKVWEVAGLLVDEKR